jgi:hypothetical protein
LPTYERQTVLDWGVQMSFAVLLVVGLAATVSALLLARACGRPDLQALIE